MKTLPALVLLAAAAPAHAQDITREGDHFKVVCHFDLPAAADQCLAFAEKAWATAEELVRVEKKPETPYEVHLYRFRTQFEEAEKKVTDGDNKATYGFPFYSGRQAHVGIQGWLEDDHIKQHGLDHATLGRIVEACARLARHELLPVSRDGRLEWLDDGLALQVTFEVLQAEEKLEDLESDPRFATLAKVAQGLVASKRAPEAEDLVRNEFGEVDGFDRTALNFLFFHYLSQKKARKALTRCLSDLAELPADADAAEVQRPILKTLRPSKQDRPFAKFAEEIEPVWDELYPALEKHEQGWLQVGLMESGAQCWFREPAGPKPWTIRGKVTVLKANVHQLNLFLGRSGGSYAMLGFAADDGIYLWEYDPGTKEWNKLAEHKGDLVKVGEQATFEVTWNQSRKRNLVVTVNGQEIATVKLTRNMAGQWGVGANQDSLGFWQDLEIDG